MNVLLKTSKIFLSFSAFKLVLVWINIFFINLIIMKCYIIYIIDNTIAIFFVNIDYLLLNVLNV